MASSLEDAEYFSDVELYEQLRFGAIRTDRLVELYEKDSNEERAAAAGDELARRGWFTESRVITSP